MKRASWPALIGGIAGLIYVWASVYVPALAVRIDSLDNVPRAIVRAGGGLAIWAVVGLATQALLGRR